MPTYVYRRADGSTFELFQSISADPLTTCPETQQPVQRVITGGTGFILKGTGFYQTDYVNTPEKKSDENGAKAEKSDKKDDKNAAKASKPKTESAVTPDAD